MQAKSARQDRRGKAGPSILQGQDGEPTENALAVLLLKKLGLIVKLLLAEPPLQQHVSWAGRAHSAAEALGKQVWQGRDTGAASSLSFLPFRIAGATLVLKAIAMFKAASESFWASFLASLEGAACDKTADNTRPWRWPPVGAVACLRAFLAAVARALDRNWSCVGDFERPKARNINKPGSPRSPTLYCGQGAALGMGLNESGLSFSFYQANRLDPNQDQES